MISSPIRIRWTVMWTVAIAVLLALSFPSLAFTVKPYNQLQFPPLPPLTVPPNVQFQLSNGLQVYLVEDHELPLVNGVVLFQSGSRLDPPEQVGLAELTAEVMRSGGTRTHPSDALNQQLEQMAASVEVGMGEDIGSASFNLLKEDLTTGFGLFAEVLRDPAFEAKQLELSKVQAQGSIARRNDSPGEIASRELQKLLYGSDSPYARQLETRHLAAISRSDLVSFHRRNLQPQRMILGVVGDFEPPAMRSLIEQTLGDWQPTPQLLEPPTDPVQVQKGGVFLVDQPQLSQSSVRLAHAGSKWDNPDSAALQVMSSVLNGFGGRLFNEIRSRQGLAYSVYGVWSPALGYPGLFIAGGETRTEATVPFIRSLRAEIDRIRDQPITPAELARAKDSVLNAFVFNFQDPGQTLSRLLRYRYYQYPSDFIFRQRQGIEATTIADVQRVAKQYLQPDQLVTLVVGSAKTLKSSLSELGGSVQMINLQS